MAKRKVRGCRPAGHGHRCGLDGSAFVHSLGARLTHVHLNDNDGTCDLHLPPGQGTIPFVSVFRALAKVGFSGAVVAEITYHGTDDLEQAARAFRGYEAEAG